SHHSADGAPVSRDSDELEHLAGPSDSPADRILAGEEPVREGLVEDDHQRRTGPVGAGKLSPLEQGDSRGAEILRTGGAALGVRHGLARGHWTALGFEVEGEALGAKRNG